MIKIDDIEQYVKQHMSPYRFTHTLGVVATAIRLAKIYEVNQDKAIIAALLHDLAKEISAADKRKFCKEHNLYIDEYLSKEINLTHGMIAANIAQYKFDIQDENILQAIANHTLGRKNMSKLEKIIYLADIIEPNRTSYPGLDELRQLTYEDLDRAMNFALQSTIQYLKSKNKEIHPVIYSMLEYYE